MNPRLPGPGTLAALAALAAAGRVVFLWWPNVALTYVVVFAAGVAFGWRAGAVVALLAMTATDVLLTGLHPVVLVNAPAMALVGAAGGLTARFVDVGQRGGVPEWPVRAAAGFVGVTGTVAFSLASDTLTYALFLAPSGAAPAAWAGLVVAGLAFNAVPAAVNGLLFATALPQALRAAHLAGLLAPPASPGTPGPWSPRA